MINEKSSDTQIIKSVLQGNVNDFKWLVERYKKHVFSVGMMLLKNQNDTCDFLQEVFVKAYVNLATYSGNSPFRFWLLKIAYHHGVDMLHARNHYRLKLVHEHNHESFIGKNSHFFTREFSPEQVFVQGEIREIVLKAIQSLPEQYRVCVDFYFFLGLSYGEISEITCIPLNTVKSNVFRAKQMLRDALRGTIAEEYHEV